MKCIMLYFLHMLWSGRWVVLCPVAAYIAWQQRHLFVNHLTNVVVTEVGVELWMVSGLQVHSRTNTLYPCAVKKNYKHNILQQGLDLNPAKLPGLIFIGNRPCGFDFIWKRIWKFLNPAETQRHKVINWQNKNEDKNKFDFYGWLFVSGPCVAFRVL